jgi:RNA polymerase sigma-B factor
MAQSSNVTLLRRYHGSGDSRARERLIMECQPLVRSLARRYVGRGEPFDDLYQVGMVGLIKAVDRFDVSRGVEFSTYATPVVLGEIKRYFRDCASTVKLPRPMQELSLRIRKSTELLRSTLGHEPTVDELAETLEVSPESVLDGIEAGRSFHVESLSVYETDSGDVVDPSEALGVEDRALSLSQDRALLLQGLSELDGREQQVIVLHHVLDLTQSQIAERVGTSQMQVSRLLRQATHRMQYALADREEFAA